MHHPIKIFVNPFLEYDVNFQTGCKITSLGMPSLLTFNICLPHRQSQSKHPLGEHNPVWHHASFFLSKYNTRIALHYHPKRNNGIATLSSHLSISKAFLPFYWISFDHTQLYIIVSPWFTISSFIYSVYLQLLFQRLSIVSYVFNCFKGTKSVNRQS